MNPVLARVHGGPDAAGAAPHDFSTNANACGPCPLALEAVRGADALRYPDPGSMQLRRALAQLHGVTPTRIVIAASASEFIFRITARAAQLGVRDVALPAHGYGDYAAAARAWGLQPAVRAGLAWACEPSSPFGRQEADVQARVAADGILVIDRVYEPLRLAGASSFDAATLARAWQLWSPNKALGLCGVRGAYAIGPAGREDAAAELDALAPSWPLGAHGVAMLGAWCTPEVQQWLDDSRATLREWKQRQLALCRDLGWQVEEEGSANFFVATPSHLTAALRERGIQLRDCASFGLPGRVRMSAQSPAAQDALRAAVEEGP